MAKEDFKTITKSEKDRSRFDSKKTLKKRDDSLRERSKSRDESKDRFERHAKIEKPQKKDDVKTKKKKYTSEKNYKTSNDKASNDKIEKEIKNKKHQLDESAASDYENPKEEVLSSSESSSSENSDSEDNDNDNEDDRRNKNWSDIEMNNDDDDEFEQTQPFFEKKEKKRKVLSELENEVVKKWKKRKNDVFSKLEKLLFDWDTKCLTSTSNIDYKAWQLSHSARDVYFIAPDGYVYPNQSTMKKVSDAIKKKEIEEKTIASLVQPIKRVVAVNPRITFGITGLRYIGSGGGFGVQTIFYVAKEYMTEKDQTSGCLKLVKVQIPITALENFGKAVNSAIEIINEVNPKKEDVNDDE